MAIDKVLRGIPFLRQELTKIFMKRAADKSGIMQIPFKNKKLQLDIEDRVQKYIRDAQKQGVDLDMVSNENLKYTINLNENVDPISRVISADSPEGRKITEALLGKKGEVVDMTGKKIDTSQGIMGGKSVEELMKSGQVTKGAKDMKKSKKVQDREMFEGANKKFNKASKADETQFFKDVDEAGGMEAFLDANPIPGPGGNLTKKFNETDNFVTNTITKIKSMKPMDAMKEANFVIGRKNKYKNLTPEQSKKILTDTEDHIFERDIIPDPEDMADGGVAGLLGERQNFKMGKRAFLKLMGGVGAGIAGLKSGLLGLGGKQATKQVAKELITTPNAPGKPAWFDALVTRVINEGDDVTKKFATKDREIVYRKKIDDETEVLVTQDLDNSITRVDIDDSVRNVTGFDDPPTVSLQVTDEIVEEGGIRTKPKFEAIENDYRNYATDPDGGYETEFVENVVENTKDLTSDLTKVKSFATKKKPTMKEILESKKRKDNVNYAQENPSSYAADRAPDYDPTDYIDDMADDFASGGIARMLGE